MWRQVVKSRRNKISSSVLLMLMLQVPLIYLLRLFLCRVYPPGTHLYSVFFCFFFYYSISARAIFTSSTSYMTATTKQREKKSKKAKKNSFFALKYFSHFTWALSDSFSFDYTHLICYRFAWLFIKHTTKYKLNQIRTTKCRARYREKAKAKKQEDRKR